MAEWTSMTLHPDVGEEVLIKLLWKPFYKSPAEVHYATGFVNRENRWMVNGYHGCRIRLLGWQPIEDEGAMV